MQCKCNSTNVFLYPDAETAECQECGYQWIADDSEIIDYSALAELEGE